MRAWIKWGMFVLAAALWSAGAHAAETTTYMLTDVQGTVIMTEDANGVTTSQQDYRPYGQPNGSVGPDGPGYTGHVNDPGTGLVYMQARYYDPEVGRFLSVDPVGVEAGNEFNFDRYDYANNSPVLNIDPDGRASKVAYLVRLTARGMKKVAALSIEEAARARRGGKNVLALRKQVARQIEEANGGSKILRHKGHDLGGGAKGLPHFQTESMQGHTFWGKVSILAVWSSDELEDVAGYLDYLPDMVPRPADEEDMKRWEREKQFIRDAWSKLKPGESYFTPPKSYFHRPPPPPPPPPPPSDSN